MSVFDPRGPHSRLPGRLALAVAVCLVIAVGGRPRAAQPATDAPAVPRPATRAPSGLDKLRDVESRVARLRQSVSEATVALTVGTSRGSGVIVSSDGYVLTAAHVGGSPGRSVTVRLSDGREVRGRTLGLNRTADSGLVKINGSGRWPHLEMAEDELEEGQWCLSTGYPGTYPAGDAPVVRVGRVLFMFPHLICTDCVLTSGDSGGPLVNLDGKVVGIHSRVGRRVTTNFHVPVASYREVWDRLVASEAWGGWHGDRRAVLGVVGDPEADRCVIGEVIEGSPADRAGVEAGDVIIRADGKEVEDFADLSRLVAEHQPGDRIDLELNRESRTLRMKVELAALRKLRPAPPGRRSPRRENHGQPEREREGRP